MALQPVPPDKIRDVALRPAVLLEPAENRAPAYVTRNGAGAFICQGSQVQVYFAKSGSLEREFRFEGRANVDVGPFVSLRHENRSYMVVAVMGGTTGPLLCISSYRSNRVVQAISMPAPVTKLAVVSGGRVGSMNGCVAVATADGHVGLVDLHLGQDGSSSEEKPASLSRQEAIDIPLASSYRRTSHHGAVFVCNFDTLLKLDPTSSSVNDVEVSLLKYIPQLDSLAIGLQGGLVHLWSLENNSFLFCVSSHSDLPVVAVALQEPENDPRCCCYLWVINGANTTADVSCVTSCFMYSVNFARKLAHPEGRCIYEGYHSCRLMFEYPLNSEAVGLGEHAGSSLLVSCRTLPSNGITGDTPKQQECIEDLRLLLLTWHLLRGGRLLGTYVSVFDLNQWYRALLPGKYRPMKLCPYIGLFSLNEAAERCNDQPFLDIRIIPRSVKKFRSHNPLEERTHFPASLAFDCICITREHSVFASFRGMQRQLLYEIQDLGPSCLSSPRDLLVRCADVGLVGNAACHSSHHRNNPVAQNALLSLALEYRMVGFLKACLCHRTTMPGDPCGEPLLPFMLNWVWNTVKEIKGSLDTLCVPLYDCSGQDVEEGSFRMSSHLGELTVLALLLELGRSLACGDVDVELIDLRREVVSMLRNHIQAVLFLVDCELLPEQRSSGAAVYSWPVLQDWYRRARKDIGSPLLVDVLVKKAGCPLSWESGTYPPQSVQQVLEVYLTRGIAPWAAGALCFYFLLDVGSCLKEENSEVKKKLQRFPVASRISADLRTFVEAVWKLDHGFYQDGVGSLLEATRLAKAPLSALLSAMWPTVLRLLMVAEEYTLAMRYMANIAFPIETVDHVELHLDVWLANNRVVDALELVRKHEKLCSMDHLLGRIVALERTRGAQVAKSRLNLMLRLPLSKSEESAMSSFFSNLGETTWLCRIIPHFIQSRRGDMTVPLADRLRRCKPANTEASQEVKATLDLVQRFLRARPLPETTRHNSPPRPTIPAGAQPPCPIPTSVVHKGTTPSLSYRTMGNEAARSSMDKPPSTRGRQELVIPRVVPAATPKSCPNTPASGSHLSKKLSLQSGLEADALSLLRTPPVKPWSPPDVVRGSSVGAAQTSTLASILKLRASLPRPTTVHTDTPPTPPALPAEPCSTPDAGTRRLRFAMSDSSASDGGPDQDTTAESPAPGLQSREESASSRSTFDGSSNEVQKVAFAVLSVDQAVAGDGSAEGSFLTAAGSNSDVESGTELEDESPKQDTASHPSTWEQKAPAIVSVSYENSSSNIEGDLRTPSPASEPQVFQEGTPLADDVVEDDKEDGTDLAEEVEQATSCPPPPVVQQETLSVRLTMEEAGRRVWDAALMEIFKPEEGGISKWREDRGDSTAYRNLQTSSFKVEASVDEPIALADTEPSDDIICLGVYPEGTDVSLDGSCSISMPEERHEDKERDEDDDVILVLIPSDDEESEQAQEDTDAVPSEGDSGGSDSEEDEHVEHGNEHPLLCHSPSPSVVTSEDEHSTNPFPSDVEEPVPTSMPETNQTAQSLVQVCANLVQEELEGQSSEELCSEAKRGDVEDGSLSPEASGKEPNQTAQSLVQVCVNLVQEELEGQSSEELCSEAKRGDVKDGSLTPEASGKEVDVPSEAFTLKEHTPQLQERSLSVPETSAPVNVQSAEELSMGNSSSSDSSAQSDKLLGCRSLQKTSPQRPTLVVSSYFLRRSVGEGQEQTTVGVRTRRSSGPMTPTSKSIQSSSMLTQRTPRSKSVDPSSQMSAQNSKTPIPEKRATTSRGPSPMPKAHSLSALKSLKSLPRKDRTPSPRKVPASKNEEATARGRVSRVRIRRGQSSSPKSLKARRSRDTPSPLPLGRLHLIPPRSESRGASMAKTEQRVARTLSPTKSRRGQTPRASLASKKPRTPIPVEEPPSSKHKHTRLSVSEDNQLAVAKLSSPERSAVQLPKSPLRRSTRLTPQKQAPEDVASRLEEAQVEPKSARKSPRSARRKLPPILEHEAVLETTAGQPSTQSKTTPRKSMPRVAAVEVPLTRLRSRQLSGDAGMENAAAGSVKRKRETEAEPTTSAPKLKMPHNPAKKVAGAAVPGPGSVLTPPMTRLRSARRATSTSTAATQNLVQQDATASSSTPGRKRVSPSVEAARNKLKKLIWKKRSLPLPGSSSSADGSSKFKSSEPDAESSSEGDAESSGEGDAESSGEGDAESSSEGDAESSSEGDAA